VKSITWLFSAWIFIFISLQKDGIMDRLYTGRKLSFESISGSRVKQQWYSELQPFDILINEIMPDPSPGVYLPEYEYIELINLSGKPIDLEACTLEVGTKVYSLTGAMDADEFLILTYKPAVKLFQDYGKVLGLFTASAALANTEQTLILRDRNGNVIDAVQYTDKWYGDSFKMQGGWSLERIDTSNPCAGKENWTASISCEGGTPGNPNSVRTYNPDVHSPYLKGIQLLSENEINILFNESISRSFFQGKDPFLMLYGNNTVINISPAIPFYNSCIVTFQQPFPEGEIYQVMTGDGFSDCSGNVPSEPLTIRFGKPVKPGFTDIILTEVLYAPFPGCPEFVEIYNNTGKLTDLSGIILGVNYNDQEEPQRVYLVNEQFLFFPGEYLVLSSDPEILNNYYDVSRPGNLFFMKKMPSLRDAGGGIELLDRSFQLIDRYYYSGQQQYPLLNDDNGVSLERMSIDRSPGYLSQWHSASSLSGFATPGYANSQLIDVIPHEETFIIEPGTFTPDNDGKDDVTVISFTIKGEGYAGNILIFNAMGICVRHLVKNELFGFEGHVIWDGTDDNGKLSGTGIYLIFMDAFNLKGEKIRRKATVLLVRR